MINLLGSILIELRDDADVGTWCDNRVRGEELSPGDALAHGNYRRWVLIQRTGGLPRERRAPVQYPRFVLTVGGVTPEDAMTGYGYVSDALHLIGTRLRNNGHGIYISFEDAAPDPDQDPDTQQPIVTSIYQVIAPTMAIAV